MHQRRGSRLACAFFVWTFAVPAGVHAADSLGGGSLFTHADERNRLDEARRELDQPKPVASEIVKRPPRPLPRVRVRGILQKNGGEATVWLNDRSTLAGNHVEKGIRIKDVNNDGTATVELNGRRQVRMQPGEVFDPKRRRVTPVVDPSGK